MPNFGAKRLMEKIYLSETSVNVYQTKRRQILNDSDLDSHSSEDLKSKQKCENLGGQ
jgi:hypothetical protein